MTQDKLFHEDIYEALRTDIMAAGGTKVVGLVLFPEKTHKAGDYLATCLNHTRNEKLDPEQILVIKRLAAKAGCYATHRFEEADLGMTNAQPIEPEDEKARIQREVVKAADIFKQYVERLERLNK
jgi:hypothetical protein